ncbi:MAG TPA: S9 family peptidase [Kofleriaceae bacterium]|nr:S9 family peptidase [Kofleriaceae bacterium]
MLAMQRVSDPQVSPDGKWVAFSVRDTDYDANKGRYDVYVAAADGSSVTRLTTDEANDQDAKWSPDGKWVYFMSTRSGSSQVWKIRPAGGEAEQVTKLDTDLNAFRLMPDGKRLVLSIDVWPDTKTLADSIKRDGAKEKQKVKARAYDQLLFRHWDQWEDGKFSHLFMWTSDSEVKDLTPGLTTDTPIHPFGGTEQFTISPDGKWMAYVARVGGKEIAYTTNTDIFLVATDGKGKAINVTADNKAYDFDPTWSRDGKSFAFTAMKKPGFEADRTRITIYDVASKKSRVVTENWDRSAGSLTWSADGKTIYTNAENIGNEAIFAIDVASGAAKALVEKGSNNSAQLAGDRLVFSKDTLKMPAELFSMKLDGSDVKQLTHFNDERVKKIQWGDYEQFSFKGAKGDTVYGYVMKPAGYTSGKAPVAFLIHGGPQGSFGDHFHYRWNPEVYAGHGYATVFIDFHGSAGYGQAFEDEISGDWGGAPFEDLMTGLDEAVKKYPWLDNNRVAALGASYGGYMINWINGHTDRFKALVCHDGIFDTRFGYFDTEEVWFPEWEHKGTPWTAPEEFEKFNPEQFVKNWKTPTLVIHGSLDYRIPESHGFAAFTALQRRNIPSRFLSFPDENHWVLKPQNSKLWHDEVLGWIDRYTKK